MADGWGGGAGDPTRPCGEDREDRGDPEDRDGRASGFPHTGRRGRDSRRVASGMIYRESTMNDPKARARRPAAKHCGLPGCVPVPVPASARAKSGPVEGAAADGELAAFAKAVGHPARVRILRLLSHRSTCVCGDLVDAMPLAQSTVSQHLKVLKAAGLVQGTIDGPRVCYCIRPEMLRRLKVLVAAL